MFTCTRKKDSFKGLTVGKEYDGTEDGNSIIVVNDLGFRARYAKDYFREVLHAAETPAAARRGRAPRVQEATPPPPPPPPPFNTAQECSITIGINDNMLSINLEALGYSRVINLNYHGTRISCGVYQIDGISGISITLNDFIQGAANNNGRCTTGGVATLSERIINQLIRTLRTRTAFVILSDSIDEDELDGFQLALSDHPSVNWSEARNPNSENIIRVWIIKTEAED